MTLSTSPHSQRAVILDWQGLPWTVREAHATPYGFEVYKGYPGLGPQPGHPHTWILTAPLAEHIRTLRPKVSGDLPFLACTVFKMRKRMGLVKPVIKTTSPKHIWTKHELALLGTGSDRAIAKKLGKSKTSVTVKRRSLDIPHFEPWSPEQLALLGTDTDINVAKMLGVTERRIRIIRMYKKIQSFKVQQQAARAKEKVARTKQKEKAKAKAKKL